MLDLCAGAGGKTLALAALMQNTGQLYAYDADRHQLKPIFDRIKRAGVRNVQVLRAGDEKALEALGARFDVVMADAPCTGSGTWRRRPDAKWRLKPEALAARDSRAARCVGARRRAGEAGGPARLRDMLDLAGGKHRANRPFSQRTGRIFSYCPPPKSGAPECRANRRHLRTAMPIHCC